MENDRREQNMSQSENLADEAQENEGAIRDAVAKDIGKPLVQTQVLEILCVKNDASRQSLKFVCMKTNI